MSVQNEYSIHIAALKEGNHLFEYIIDNDFLYSINYKHNFTKTHIEVSVDLVKHNNFFELSFTYFGHIHTTCERCAASNIPVAIWESYDMIVKQVSEMPVDDGDDTAIAYILFRESFFDVRTYLIDFFKLAIPMVKQCSEQDLKDATYCDKSVLATINGTIG